MNGRHRTARQVAGAGAALLMAAALLVAAAILAPGTATAQTEAEPAVAAGAAAAEPEVVEMVVTGLACPLCVAGLERRMERLEGLAELAIDPETGKVTVVLEGVERVERDPETGKVAIVLEDGREVTEERIRQLVSEAGFTVDRFERAPWVADPS